MTHRFVAAAFLAMHALAAAAEAPAKLTTLEMVGRYAQLAQVAAQRAAAEERPGTSVLAPLCFAYSKLKDYRKLYPCLDRLEQQVRSGDATIMSDRFDVSDSDATPFAGMLRAEALVEMGDYGAAAARAREALASVRERLPFGMWPAKTYRLSILSTLGLAHALAGDRDNAIAQVKALEDFPIGFMGRVAFTAIRDNGIARIHVALGEYAKALPYLKDEGALAKATFLLNDTAWGFSGDDARETSLLLPKLLLRGKCLLETGDLPGARADLDAALRNVRISEFGELYWRVLFERGRIAQMEGNAEDAMQLYRRAVEVIERQRSSINTEANKIGFAGDKQQVYANLVAALVAGGRAADAFGYVERAKSRALVDLLAAKADFAAREVGAAKAGQLLANLDSADMVARIQDDGAKAGEKAEVRGIQAAKEDVRRSAPGLSSLVTVTSVSPEDLRALVAADETLVEYYYQGKDLYAFVASRQRLEVARLDGERLPGDVRALRDAVRLPDARGKWMALSRSLYDRLWKPIDAMVATQKVVVVPHGVLHYLPFAALERDDGKQLVDRVALRFLPSASVLGLLRRASPDRDLPVLALGNPDLGDPGLDLEFGESEARAVAGMFPDSRLLVRAGASETNFRKSAGQYRRIHFATHGKFRADDALGSGLYLARDADNDGVLTVGELYSLELNADLVTLSACETGLGRISNGDDVVGLTRGFLYAGASSVVASLWEVEDKSTAALMRSFYANLSTLDRQEALRQAQVSTRRDAPHPMFWAAFQLVGRGGAAPSP